LRVARATPAVNLATNPNAHPHADPNAHANPDSDANVHAHANSHPDSNAIPDADSVAGRGFYPRATGNGLGAIGPDV